MAKACAVALTSSAARASAADDGDEGAAVVAFAAKTDSLSAANVVISDAVVAVFAAFLA